MAIHAVPHLPPRALARAGVARALDAGAGLVVVRGPAGSGKTTAVARWAGEQRSGGVWLTVASTNDTRERFWRAIVVLLAEAGEVTARNPLYGAGGALASVRELRPLLVRGLSSLRNPTTIVVDGVNHISDAEVIEDIVTLIEASPRLRFVVTSSAWTAFESDATRAWFDVDVVSPDMLIFTTDEITELIDAAGIADDTGDLARAVRQATRGSAILTRSVLDLVEREGLSAGGVRDRVEELGAALVRSALAEGDTAGDDADFWQRVSVAEVLTAELAGELSGRDDAARLLRKAESRGFATRLGGSSPRFVLDATMRTAMREELERRHPDELPGLLRTVAKWGFRNGHTLSALRDALAIDDLDLASRVFTEDFVGLASNSDEVVRLLGARPIIAYRSHPVLALMLGFAYLHHDAKGSKSRAVEAMAAAVAFSRAMASRVDPITRIAFVAGECGALRGMGRADSGVQTARRAARVIRELGPDQRDRMRVILPPVAVHVGLSFFYGDASDEAVEMFESIASLTREENLVGHFEGTALLAAVHAVEGRMTQARGLVQYLRAQEWPRELRESMLGAGYQIAEATLALEGGGNDAAVNRVEARLRDIPTLEHWPLYAHVRSLALIGIGRASHGLAALDADEAPAARMVTGRRMRILLAVDRALLLASAGRLAEAHAALAKAGNAAVATIARARIHLLQSETEHALAALQRFTPEDLAPRQWVDILLLRAVCGLRMSHAALRDENAERALALLEEFGLRHPFSLLSPSDRRGLLETVAGHADPALVTGLEAVRGHWPEPQPRALLTPREADVLGRLALGEGQAQIATVFGVSVNTVKTQMRSLYRKLGATTREEAVHRGRNLSLPPGR